MSRKDDRRSLGDEDRKLWDVFTKPIKPLPKRATVKAPDVDIAPPPPKPAKKVQAVAPPAPPVKAPPPLAPLGRREKARVARGKIDIEGRLDLHGHTQAEAHGELLRFLRKSVAAERRLVLVITGKSGVLRRQVPLWLALPEFRELLIGFEPAALRHGGEGALYLRLRRNR
jgi:DNA-nicking Smr family endonuclease